MAEEANVRIGIHPDDPPVPELGGVPRCIFSNFDGYKRAMEIADSPNVGICLCVGCWLEGGKLMGKDVIETIKYFGERKKIFKVHLRNVSQPLPHFVETFLEVSLLCRFASFITKPSKITGFFYRNRQFFPCFLCEIRIRTATP